MACPRRVANVAVAKKATDLMNVRRGGGVAQQSPVVAAPTYLSPETLPFASDILYHGHIVYFSPTGILPEEWSAVAGFPAHCREKRIGLPQIVWEMCKGYFESSQLAFRAAEILRPLQPAHVLIVLTSYDRDVKAVRKAKAVLQQHPELLELFGHVRPEFPFLSRELMSHLFLDLFMQEGYAGVVRYLGKEADSPDRFVELLVAVLLNRCRLFTGRESHLLLYEGSWYPFLMRASAALQDAETKEATETTDAESVEFMCYKLFETILLPVFGRIDTAEKAELVAQTASDRNAEVSELKATCRRIARDVATAGTTDSLLKNELLRDAIRHDIEEPLAALLRKPRKDTSELLRDVLLDSGLIAGLLGVLHGVDAATLGTAAAAGALSAGFRFLIAEHSQQRTQASSLLVAGMNKVGLAEQDLQNHLRGIRMENIELPSLWQELASGETPPGQRKGEQSERT
jgi:hypothetical protein